MIPVTPRARSHRDRAGDPLDGLVNLFDLGIVLSVGFLLAALASLHLSSALTHHNGTSSPNSIPLQPGQQIKQITPTQGKAAGHGQPVGQVYRLPNGQLVLVTNGTTSGSSGR